LDGVSLVLKSPGLSPHDARISALLATATQRGIDVGNELTIFITALAELNTSQNYAPKIIAITGTNGKTTTTSLTTLLVASTGKTVAMAGNIGPTLLGTLMQMLSSLPEVWVLELSSFQLDGVTNFNPDAATILNITQDHLDWHGSMEAYIAAKERIFGTNTIAVVNRDETFLAQLPAKQISFGLNAPPRLGDFGLINLNDADESLWLAHRTTNADLNDHVTALMPANALRIRGRHNAANALAALALASAIECPRSPNMAPMLAALREYIGEPHRVQLIRTINGVEFYDDSKGTNVGATVAALEGLGLDKAPGKLVLILGGDGKGQDFSPLTAPLAQHARAIATIGRDAATIEAIISGIPTMRHQTLEAAVKWCFSQALPGDAVLLSPACASLDMFRNYAHRAEVFVQATETIAHDCGLV
jgi:UDP-N-acetylmuramoylalanine--D-glutamate ligase